MSKITDRWCFAWYASNPTVRGAKRAALVANSMWSSGDTITISFMDGDSDVQDRVEDMAKNWTVPGLADLTLQFENGPNTDVRISFKYRGSWSVIGKSCLSVPKGQPTMNFGWLNKQSADDEVRRVVLHEFGHALGLIHEHQNPINPIQWNREAVIASLSGPPNNWSPDVIEHNMFETYDKESLHATQRDAQSIMMYPIPAEWTLDGFSVGLNSDLSKQDRKFIHEQYP